MTMDKKLMAEIEYSSPQVANQLINRSKQGIRKNLEQER